MVFETKDCAIIVVSQEESIKGSIIKRSIQKASGEVWFQIHILQTKCLRAGSEWFVSGWPLLGTEGMDKYSGAKLWFRIGRQWRCHQGWIHIRWSRDDEWFRFQHQTPDFWGQSSSPSNRDGLWFRNREQEPVLWRIYQNSKFLAWLRPVFHW